MDKDKGKVVFIGGDRRMLRAAAYVRSNGFNVAYRMLGGHDDEEELFVSDEDVVVLPAPVSSDGESLNAPLANGVVKLESLLKELEGKVVIGGKLPDGHSCKAFDYSSREEFTSLNAVPTAEGAVQIAMEKLPVTLAGTNVLIVGYGKVGKECARAFHALGSRVTVAVRRECVLQEIGLKGYTPLKLSEVPSKSHDFLLIINTVPAKVIERKTIDKMREDCLLIELASAPWGIDFEAAAEYGIDSVVAGGLPGKVAPETAGEIIGKMVINIIEEMGVAKK